MGVPQRLCETAHARYLWASALGLVGFWLNRIPLALLSAESPLFLLGGALPLVSFVRLGTTAGVLTTLLSLGERLARLDAVGLATLPYVLEAGAASWLRLRLHSLPLSVVVYWLGVGWLVDGLVYGGLVGLSRDYVTLLFIKQVFNGALNGLVADLALRALPKASPATAGEAPSILRHYVSSRVAFVALLASLALSLVFTRWAYNRQRETALARADGAASATVTDVTRFLLERQAPLRALARRIEIDWVAKGPGPSPRLEGFRASHPEVFNVGLADRNGLVLDMSPRRNVLGQPIDRGDISAREYLREARASLRTTYAALILGTLHVREPRETEPVLVVAEPLLDHDGGFTGLLIEALDAGKLRALLAGGRKHDDELPTLSDRNGTVIASLDPRLAPGMSLSAFVPPAPLPQAEDVPRQFSYSPPPDGSVESRLGLDIRYCSSHPVLLSGWRVSVDLPAESLHAGVARSAIEALVFFLASLVLLWFTVSRSMDGLAVSLDTIGRAATAVTEADGAPAAAFRELAASPIAEIRDLVGRFATMEEAVTSQKRHAAAALADKEARLREVLEHSNNLFYSRTPEDLLTYVSPQAAQFLDCTPEEAMVRWTEFAPDTPRNRSGREATERAVRTGLRQPPYELDIVTRKGRHLIVEVNETPVVRDGRVAAVVGALTDITARRAAEEAQAAAEERLDRARRLQALGRLAGGIAHEFNNVFALIRGSGELLLRGLRDGDPSRQRAEQVIEASQRGARLTRGLLAFGRRQVLEPGRVDLNDAIAQRTSLLQRLLGGTIALRFVPGADLHPAWVDPGQLDDVLLSLATNARDAMPGGGTLTIETRDTEIDASAVDGDSDIAPGRFVLVAVTDTGGGMDAEARSRVFEPFFTTKEMGQAAGLSLAALYGVIKQSGGHVAVESEPGRGTTFRILLPAAPREAEAVPPPRPGEPPPAERAPETVLVVEDDAGLRETTAALVEDLGYRVLTATDGVDALAVAARHEGGLDLLLTDIVMPRMDGVELVRRLRADRPGLKALFVSGHPDPAGERGAPGPQPLLLKPFSRESLAGRLRELLEGPEAFPLDESDMTS